MFLRRLMKDLVLPVAVAITLALLIQAAVAKPYEIPTPSMDPTIHPHDRIIANRLIYHFRDISRGDIIVFHPTAEARATCGAGGAPPGTPYVKRVIGLPGETVTIIWNTRDVEINGKRFTVPAARRNNASTTANPDNPVSTYQVPAGKLFVLGDNRPESCDSHMWSDPFVPIGNVIGQAEVTYWPLKSAAFLK